MPLDSRGVLEVTDADGVRRCVFDRPDKRNAFNQALWYALADALADASTNDTVHCVVVTGAGGAFTAGQDLAEMADPTVFENQEPGYRRLMPVVEEFPKPLLAAVNGVGVGIGLTLLLHCDLVLMGRGARLKAPFVSLGVTTEASASVLLPATVGWQRAAEILFTEPWIDAERAVELGIALRVVDDATVLDDTMALARSIATLPLGPLMTTKRMLVAGRIDAVRAARAREEAEFARLVGDAANAAALGAFLGGDGA